MTSIHHLLLYTIALLYCIKPCHSIPQNIDDNSLKITPINNPNNNNNDIPTNTQNMKYNIHDHTIYQRKWNDYLKNGRDSRQSREPVYVDYMGMRKLLLFSVACISTCSV